MRQHQRWISYSIQRVILATTLENGPRTHSKASALMLILGVNRPLHFNTFGAAYDEKKIKRNWLLLVLTERLTLFKSF